MVTMLALLFFALPTYNPFAMKNRRPLKERLKDYLYDYPVLKFCLENGWAFLVCTLSALCFAFSYKCFIVPNCLVSNPETPRLVSGGVSGLSQVIGLIIQFIPGNFLLDEKGTVILANEDMLFSILYFAINIPIFVLAFFGIGKRFAIYTVINVAEVSLFTNLLGLVPEGGFMTTIATFVNNNGGMLSRALLGGVFTGLSSALAYKIDASAGGIDIIAYYIALKKSAMVGKYQVAINIGIMLTFTLLSCAKLNWSATAGAGYALSTLLFCFIYMLVTKIVIDVINLRNKKVEITVITHDPSLSEVLVASLPHAATVVEGKGAYSGKTRYIITMVVSSYEVRETVSIIREADPKSFVKVNDLHQVFGRFFIKPIK